MKKSLAGTIFVRNGVQFDYNFVETIKCLIECTDHVYIVDAGSDDLTVEILNHLRHPKATIIYRDKDEWDSIVGKEKLSYFTNIAIEAAEMDGYDYQLNVQADEILHERSYDVIRKAIETGEEAFMCSRTNLWGDCYHKLVVPHNRQPCSTEIIRLAKTKYRSYDDAESLATPLVSFDFVNQIDIIHYGFVRKKEVMKDKIINMQKNIFAMNDYDEKLKTQDVFDSTAWFSGDDLALIDYPHPKIMREWIKARP